MKKLLPAFAVLLALSCASCREKDSLQKTPEEPLPAIAQRLSRADDETKAFLSDKKICVVLGYGYNDEAFVEKARALLNREYGVETEDQQGLVLLYVYPEDFDVSGKTRISRLVTLVEDYDLAGLLILGAPEGMNIPLAKLQDNAGGSLSYPIFSLFPQDEVLASEATADFVLDYANISEGAPLQEEMEVVQDFDAESLITNSIQEMISLRGSVSADTDLLTFVQDIVGSQRTISHYTDAESGIQSRNHFIFQ